MSYHGVVFTEAMGEAAFIGAAELCHSEIWALRYHHLIVF